MADNDGFQTVSLKKRNKKRQNKKNLSEEEIITDKLFNKYNTLIQKSLLFKNLVPNLDYVKDVRCIRCLALGSFIEEIQPLYQLSLLIEIVNHLIELNCKDDDYSLVVSLYDPAFTPKDILYINSELNNKRETSHGFTRMKRIGKIKSLTKMFCITFHMEIYISWTICYPYWNRDSTWVITFLII